MINFDESQQQRIDAGLTRTGGHDAGFGFLLLKILTLFKEGGNRSDKSAHQRQGHERVSSDYPPPATGKQTLFAELAQVPFKTTPHALVKGHSLEKTSPSAGQQQSKTNNRKERHHDAFAGLPPAYPLQQGDIASGAKTARQAKPETSRRRELPASIAGSPQVGPAREAPPIPDASHKRILPSTSMHTMVSDGERKTLPSDQHSARKQPEQQNLPSPPSNPQAGKSPGRTARKPQAVHWESNPNPSVVRKDKPEIPARTASETNKRTGIERVLLHLAASSQPPHEETTPPFIITSAKAANKEPVRVRSIPSWEASSHPGAASASESTRNRPQAPESVPVLAPKEEFGYAGRQLYSLEPRSVGNDAESSPDHTHHLRLQSTLSEPLSSATSEPQNVPLHRTAAVSPVPQLTRIIHNAVQQELSRIDIKIHPEHLGSIRILLESDKSKTIHVHFVVDQGAARHLIEQHLPQLRQQLAQEGLDLGGFSMSFRQQEGRGKGNPFPDTPKGGNPAKVGNGDTPAYLPHIHSGRLSIRI